ncbi:hypothetical protein HY492_03840 [Candidatus Woesearchaeota archaeon]|nr:hypothetical protein [Candidatus Woesearchaeota archaeon]
MGKEDASIERAMEAAERLSRQKIPTEKEIAAQFEADMARAAKARKLLKRVREPVSRRKTASKGRKK